MGYTIFFGLLLLGVVVFAVIQFRSRHDQQHGLGADSGDFEKARAEALAQEGRWSGG